MPDLDDAIKFNRVALRYQPNNMRAVDGGRVILAYLKSHNIDHAILHADREPTGIRMISEEEERILEHVNLIVSIGGDGTFLSSTRLATRKGIPVFGVHLGGLGFLTEIRLEEALKGLERVLKGDYYIEERIMLEIDMETNGICHACTALNDIVFHRVSLSRMVDIEIDIDEHPVVSYQADGVIISTPTGSTAYSLSAGGSILWPDIEALILTPISPHTLGSRPLIIPSDKIIGVRCPTAYKAVISVTLDGQQSRQFDYPVSFNVRKSAKKAKLVRIERRHFSQILRDKLNWGRSFK
jgi:NAD+ kinase